MDEATLRLSLFIGVFLLCAVLEWRNPNRQWRSPRLKRWFVNLGLTLLNTIIVRITVGAVAVTAALWAQNHGIGLLQLWAMPVLISAVLGFLLLDFIIWFQHWVTHRWTWLWRLHKVHHTDLELDVTSALRFHPVEILLSMVFKAGVVILLGIDAWTVIVFEAVLNASAIFTHANIRIPHNLDRALRYVICTPDMHRVHHSTVVSETNSNYGFFLSIWDRLWGTYTLEPKAGVEGMDIGLKEHRLAEELKFLDLIKLPFRN